MCDERANWVLLESTNVRQFFNHKAKRHAANGQALQFCHEVSLLSLVGWRVALWVCCSHIYCFQKTTSFFVPWPSYREQGLRGLQTWPFLFHIIGCVKTKKKISHVLLLLQCDYQFRLISALLIKPWKKTFQFYFEHRLMGKYIKILFQAVKS